MMTLQYTWYIDIFKSFMIFSLLNMISPTIVDGQNHNDRLIIGDLNEELASTSHIATKALIINDICLYYQVKDYQADSVIINANRLLDFAIDNKYAIASVLGHGMLGSQYTRMSKIQKGKAHLHKALAIADSIDYDENIYDIYNPLAKNYYQQNKLDSALYYFNKCLDTAPKYQHSKHVYFYLGLAAIYDQLGQISKEGETLHLAAKEATSGGIKLDRIIALTALLDYYSLKVNDISSFNRLKKEYDGLMSGYDGFKNNLHSNFLLHDSMPYNEKVDFLKRSLIDNKDANYVEGVFYNYIQLQKSYLANENFQACADISVEALSYYNDQNAVRLELLLELYQNKWLSESELGNPKIALATVKKYNHLKDSLIQANNSKHINELNIKYESIKKDAQLSERVFQVNKRTAQRNYAILLSVILSIFGYFLWRRSTYKQQQIEAKNKLQAEQIANLEHEKKILSLTSMIEGQEAERLRIAQDLHDGLGGLLSSVKNHFSLIQEEVRKIDKLNVYDRTNNMIDQACKEVRRISHNLMPASLQLNGLLATIDQYCKHIESSHKIEVLFEHNGLEGARLKERQEIFIYRIIQEATTNVLKHAKATNLMVQLALYENEISIIVEDDGVGFDVNEKKDGIGLQSIRSRVYHLKGQLDINSKINSGTTITINIPHE